ncbi:hypothetical protein CPC16_003345 [Podila verticillata]|nr:hypothetical protein CPC16_003345 [Podila verticillata]
MLLKQTATLTRLARTYSLSTPSTRLSLTASRAYASTSTPRRSQAQALEDSHPREAHQQKQHPTSSPGTSGSPVGASGIRVPYYTLAELESMTLQDLRALCKENGLKVGGRKKELVNRTHKYVLDHHQPHATKPASKNTVQEANSTERAHIKDQLEWEARLEKEQAAQMKQLEKEAQASEKREMEKRAREAQEKEAAALAKQEKHERELRLKEQQENEARKKEQYEKELRLKHEKEARLAKEKHEHELRVKEQHEKEARLKKEQHEKEARLKKEQHEKEAHIAKEKHEHELRVKEQHEKEARLKMEQHEKEARLKKEQLEKEAHLAKDKHEHELRLKEAREKEAHMKKEMEAKEALVKKEQHQKELLLKAEEEKRKEQLAAAAKRVQSQAVDQEHQNEILSAREGSSSHRSDSNEWAKEKLPLGTRAAGLAMGLGIMAWFLSGKRDRWAEAQEQAKAQERARLHGEKLKE